MVRGHDTELAGTQNVTFKICAGQTYVAISHTTGNYNSKFETIVDCAEAICLAHPVYTYLPTSSRRPCREVFIESLRCLQRFGGQLSSFCLLKYRSTLKCRMYIEHRSQKRLSFLRSTVYCELPLAILGTPMLAGMLARVVLWIDYDRLGLSVCCFCEHR
jgi:hypothetical protein